MKERDSYYRYYRRVNNTVMIDISIPEIREIYNPLDPSPYPERSLRKNLEDYIIGAVRDFPLGEYLEIVFYVPRDEIQDEPVRQLENTIRNHFRYKEIQARREMGDTFRSGRIALVIGLFFLALTLLASYMIARKPDTIVNEIIRNSLLIIGWVAMWQPISIFFYAWQPFRQKLKIYQKICGLKVSVMPLEETYAGTTKTI